MTDIDLNILLDDPRCAIGAAQIEAIPPSGEDLRNEPAYDSLETEFRKIEADGPTAVDWKRLNRETLAILQGRSKDVVLASRLVYGLYREEGYRGMAVGISVLKGMIADHWDGMFPPPSRERGRAGALDWMAQKLATTVEAEPPADDSRRFALVAHDRLVELDGLLAEKMQKFPVAIGPLIRALRPHSREARQALEAEKAASASSLTPPAAAPPAVAEPAATAAPATTAFSPPPPVPATTAVAMPVPADIPLDGGAEKALQAIFGSASRVASAVRQEAPGDARAYLCARFGIWGQIAAAPPEKAGRTALPSLQKVRLSEIRSLRAAGNHQGLLMAAESAFFTSPFWLDAQYLVAQSMKALGAPYAQAHAVVLGELALFLKRIPGLAALSFNDGTPFAEAETASWIAAEVEAATGTQDTDSELDKVKATAGMLGQQGALLPGLQLLDDFAESRRGERERFFARIEVGEFCLRFDMLQPLFGLIAKLDLIALEASLSRWEPQLASALANLSWRALSHKNAKRHVEESQLLERRSAIVATLADADIVLAARFSTA